MADNKPQKLTNAAGDDDSLLNLKFAQAEADLEQHTGGMGPVANEYISTDEDGELDEGPRDRQGQRRGETDPTDAGSQAGSHS